MNLQCLIQCQNGVSSTAAHTLHQPSVEAAKLSVRSSFALLAMLSRSC